jgi:hypothetical protein
MSFEREFEMKLDPNQFIPEARNVINEYICPLCQGVILEPVSDTCGHIFCEECIQKHIDKKKKCPLSGASMLTENLIHVNCLKNIIYKQQLYCTYREDGCEWIGPYSVLAAHREKECQYELVRCPNSDCSVSMRRNLLKTHEPDCDYKQMDCRNKCGIKLAGTKADDHLKHCPKELVTCPQSCGEKFERQGEANHLKRCSNTLMECSFKEIGCEYRLAQGAVESHNKENHTKHLSLLMDYTLKWRKEFDCSKEGKADKRKSGKPGRPKKGNSDQENNIMEVDDYVGSPKKKPTGKRFKAISDNEDKDNLDLSDFDIIEEPRKITNRKPNGKAKGMKPLKLHPDDKLLDICDFPSFEEVSDIDDYVAKKTNGKKEEKEKNFIGQKRSRGRPPKSELAKKTPNNEPVNLIDIPSSFEEDIEGSNEDSVSVKENICHLSIDKSNVPLGIELKDDRTAILKKPVRNQHRLIFGNTYADRDMSWSVKINKLNEKGWMAMGLCEKSHFLANDHKFNKGDPHGFLISSNGFAWNANSVEHNDKPITFPRLESDSVVELTYSNKLKTLTFKNGAIKYVLNKVYLEGEYLTPCVIFLNYEDDSASFI